MPRMRPGPSDSFAMHSLARPDGEAERRDSRTRAPLAALGMRSLSGGRPLHLERKLGIMASHGVGAACRLIWLLTPGPTSLTACSPRPSSTPLSDLLLALSSPPSTLPLPFSALAPSAGWARQALSTSGSGARRRSLPGGVAETALGGGRPCLGRRPTVACWPLWRPSLSSCTPPCSGGPPFRLRMQPIASLQRYGHLA